MTVMENIHAAFPAEKQKDPHQINALILAYAGDTVYDLYVRTYLIQTSGAPVHTLHIKAAKLVCAAAQAEAYRTIEPLMTEEENAVFRRGRNAHSGTTPKNASVTDYRIATGVEALFGFLYLSGRDERISELMRLILDSHNAKLTD